MNKVMTRTHRRPGTRPDTRPPGQPGTRPSGRPGTRPSGETGTRPSGRPGGAPPRTPGGSVRRTPGGGSRPPGSPGDRSRTGPRDTRPPARPNRTAAPTPQAARPEVRTAQLPLTTDLFADRLLAVLSGQKPVHWMLRHTVGRAYDELAWLAERGPLRTRGTRPVVRDIGYYEPRPGAVEAFARIGAGDQLRAMAFRLELGRDLRWRCTAVELGGPRPPHPNDD
ncbi:Rv3235 family protein [Streptomyces anandii]|uniref:Rv3235 family protein n=1 Tax=Streptomyces anandii TaxID=285454 RepID=A0ABW6HB62_9ACTN